MMQLCERREHMFVTHAQGGAIWSNFVENSEGEDSEKATW